MSSALNKKTVEDLQVAGKKVLVRCDFNVKMENGVITSDKRIVASLPTIKYLIDNRFFTLFHLFAPFFPQYTQNFSQLQPLLARKNTRRKLRRIVSRKY